MQCALLYTRLIHPNLISARPDNASNNNDDLNNSHWQGQVSGSSAAVPRCVFQILANSPVRKAVFTWPIEGCDVQRLQQACLQRTHRVACAERKCVPSFVQPYVRIDISAASVCNTTSRSSRLFGLCSLNSVLFGAAHGTFIFDAQSRYLFRLGCFVDSSNLLFEICASLSL